ncbi:MAG: peptide chain release factor 1 [Parvularculales bacterium]
MLSDQKLDQILTRYATLESQLVNASQTPILLAERSRDYASLTPVVEAIRTFQSVRQEYEELVPIAEGDDPDLAAMAREDRASLEGRLADLEQRIRRMLLPRDKADDSNVIIEVRAGTGGMEAALFAADLFRMYQRYADLKGWKVELLSSAVADLGGYREIIASITGSGVFAQLKFESGVHRVQRVPETESGGRIHTSAATVAILPEPKDVDIVIDDKDLRVDVYRASGPGGQSVNTTDSAVRITHLPTGITVTQQDEKSQHKNRAKAMKVLRARLYETERARQANERAADRRGQVGSGDRSERVRTYNFPQGRVTDHRINLTLHKLQRILGGDDLDELINALIMDDEAGRLAAADEADVDNGS